MKRLKWLAAGCGGGGDGGGVSPHEPVISNLHYSPNTASHLNLTTTVIGSVTFSDIDGNIDTFTLNIYDLVGNEVASPTIVPITVGGATSGYFNIPVMVNTSVVGSYTFGIHVTDSAGLQSNVLTGPFTVTP